MLDYICQISFLKGKEYFTYPVCAQDTNRMTTNIAPFPENLLSLLYLDVGELKRRCGEVEQAWRQLCVGGDQRHAEAMMRAMERLAGQHIYFELHRAVWRERLEHAAREGYTRTGSLPIGELTCIPDDIAALQGQIKAFLDHVLCRSDGKMDAAQKMARYYQSEGKDTSSTFRFRPQLMSFGWIGDTAAEVLYPRNVSDLVDFSLRVCVRETLGMRICKNCGRYFALTGRSNAEYCGRPFDKRGRTCKEVGAIKAWNQKRSGDEVFREYRREYKKRFARMKAGKMTAEAFYAWSEQTRAQKKRCDRGEITAAEFQEWLRNM